jgi:hypothetical protein
VVAPGSIAPGPIAPVRAAAEIGRPKPGEVPCPGWLAAALELLARNADKLPPRAAAEHAPAGYVYPR